MPVSLFRIIAIILGILFIILTLSVEGWKRYAIWAIVAGLCILQIYLLFQDFRKEHSDARSGKISSPEVKQENLMLYFGSNLFSSSSTVLTDEILDHQIHPWPKMNTRIRKENGRIMVDIDVRNREGKRVAQIKNNEWSISDEAYDRNFDNEHFEVFDKYEDVPVLQIMFVDNIIILNGVFYTETGQKCVAIPTGYIYGANKAVKSEISPWFKYPSGEHPGELNEEAINFSMQQLNKIRERRGKSI